MGAGARSVAHPLRGHPPGRTCTATRASSWEAAEAAVAHDDADADAAAPVAGWSVYPHKGRVEVPQQSDAPPRALRAKRNTQGYAVGTQGLGFEARSMWAQVEERSEVQPRQVGMRTPELRCGKCGWR